MDLNEKIAARRRELEQKAAREGRREEAVERPTPSRDARIERPGVRDRASHQPPPTRPERPPPLFTVPPSEPAPRTPSPGAALPYFESDLNRLANDRWTRGQNTLLVILILFAAWGYFRSVWLGLFLTFVVICVINVITDIHKKALLEKEPARPPEPVRSPPKPADLVRETDRNQCPVCEVTVSPKDSRCHKCFALLC